MGAGTAPAGRRRVVAGLFVAYLAVVAFGVFGPAPDDQIQRAGGGARRVADEIGAAIPGGRKAPPEAATSDRLFGNVSTEAAANVALFVPLGLLFPVLLRRWKWWTVPAGVALSATIEGTQLVLLSWRSPSVTDVAWNSLGALIGFALWLVVRAWWRCRRP